MPITEDQVKARILAQVGDTPQGDVARQLDLLWDGFADKDQVTPRLRELYTTQAALDVLLGIYQGKVDEGESGVMNREGQTAAILLKRRALVDAQILALEQRFEQQRPGAVGLLTRTAPIPVPTAPPPYGPLDANDVRVSGSPYAPRRAPWGAW